MRMLMTSLPGLLVAAVLLPAAAQEKAPPGAATVGTKAPAFTLKDQAGKDRSLEELVKQGPVAVVFHRSAGW
jgi:hypothetical protein